MAKKDTERWITAEMRRGMKTAIAGFLAAVLFAVPGTYAFAAESDARPVQYGETEAESAPSGSMFAETDSAQTTSSPETDVQEPAKTPVTVCFKIGTATGTAPESISVAASGTVTLPDAASFSLNGKVFCGWSKTADAEKPDYSAGESVVVETDETFYAVWQLKAEHTVSYVVNGETGSEAVVTGEYPVQLPTKTADGKTQISSWTDENGAAVDPAKTRIFEDRTFTAVFAPALIADRHIVYMNGGGDGFFYPANSLSRAEAAQIIYKLLEDKTGTPASFSDVPTDSWYCTAVDTLAGKGILSGSGGLFAPTRAITRAEFVTILSRLYPASESKSVFTDVAQSHWAYSAIVSAASKGWVNGYADGNFKPNAPVSRAEAACIINRVLGRAADKSKLGGDVMSFVDVSPDYWGYYDIMEASTEHEFCKTGGTESWTSYSAKAIDLPAGLLNHNGELYYIDEQTHHPIRNATVHGFTLDSNGRYTSGSAELDAYVKQAIASVTNNSMTQLEKLRAVYNYTRDNFSYLRRNYYAVGATGWELENALVMFQTHQGNCYCFTAAFYYLSRQLGYESTAISGSVSAAGGGMTPHGWVHITFNGTVYIFDTELEMAQRLKGRYYNFFMMPYSRTPWRYAGPVG